MSILSVVLTGVDKYNELIHIFLEILICGIDLIKSGLFH